MSETKQEKHVESESNQPNVEAETGSKPSKLNVKAWVGLSLVLLLVTGVGIFRAGNLSGKATGGQGPQMGCGGGVPMTTGDTTDDAPKKPKIRLGKTSQYLTANPSASDDTYVQQGNNGPFGGETTIKIKNDDNGVNNNIRKGLIKFKIEKMKAAQVIQAKFMIDIVEHKFQYPYSRYTFSVWGLKTAGDCSANDFAEATVKRNDLKGLAKNNNGVDINHPCIYDADPSTNGAQKLGTFLVEPMKTTAVMDYTVWGLAGKNLLAEYIRSQAAAAGGASKASIVLLITRVNQHAGATTFASKEHSSKSPPRMELLYQGDHDSLDTTADTYIKLDGSGPYGNDTLLLVKNSSGYDNDRQALIKFRVSNYQTYLNPGVSLHLTLASTPKTTMKLLLWGLKTGPGCTYNHFREFALRYNHLGVSDTSSDGVKNDHSCIYQGNSGPIVTKSLLTSYAAGANIKFSSQRLRDFVAEQVRNSAGGTTDVVFLLTRETSDSSVTSFASKEHATYAPPRLKFSKIMEGNQTVCGQTCTNCPARAFKSTCVLQSTTRVVNGRTLRRIKIETMGLKLFFFGDWKEENVNGQRSFKTTSDFYLKSPYVDLIPMKVLGGSSTTISCQPYLAIESQLADMPVIDGQDAISVADLNAPKFTFGVRLGQHLREDYPTTPFGDCHPYFFVAVDTAIGTGDFKVNKKLGAKDINIMLAVDPNDPTIITEVGGSADKKKADDVKDATDEAKKKTAALKGVGLGYSYTGKMNWRSAVPVPKSVSEFDTNITKEIDGHIYGRLIVKLPTTPVDLEVDGDIFFNISNFSTAIKRTFNSAFYSRDMSGTGSDFLKNLRMGVNINSVSLDYGFFKFPIGAGSYSLENQVHRFAGYTGFDETKPPQLFKTSGSSTGAKLQDFANKFFTYVNQSKKAEVRGIINGSTNKFRIRVKAEASMSLGIKLSKQATLDINNVDSAVDAKINASMNLKDLTKNVASGDVSMSGSLNVDGNKATYSLAGSSNLTINDVKVASLAVGVSNQADKIGKVTLSGKLDSNAIDLDLSGHASKDSFEMTGSANIKLTPILKAAKTITQYFSAVKSGYKCVTADIAQCGYRYVTKTVDSVGQCFSSITCAEKVLGACVWWKCTVRQRYDNCWKCTKTENKNVEYPEVTLRLSATLHDDLDKPITGTVSFVAGGVSGGEHSFDVETRSVCYTIPTAELDLSSGFSVSSRKFCVKLPK